MTTPAGAFASNHATIDWFADRIAEACAGADIRRVLDIGCGDASLVVALADRLPHASIVVLDYSHENMLVALARVSQSPHAPRMQVYEGDYLARRPGVFDLVVAQSSLQGMPVPVETLAETLAADLGPRGRIVFTMPSRCLYNRVLNGVRRVWRACRSSLTDRLILGVAARLHPEHSAAFLRDRVEYMYFVVRHHEAALRSALEAVGLRTVVVEPMLHTSWGQPRHHLTVMTR